MPSQNETSRSILVTGGCGFIGSNLILRLLQTHPDWHITNVDSLTYAGDPDNVRDAEENSRYDFRRVDITDRSAVRDLMRGVAPDGVFHLAAETHVDNSIRGPEQFVLTNVVGTFNLLEEARQLWSEGLPGRFLHVSTDEVYGSIKTDVDSFTEESSYQPNSPYSASKAGSDHLVRSYHQTYGMNVVTTNCSNNFGPRQHREKLIPTVIATALARQPIPVYGQGLNVRDWLYVRDHCNALDLVFLEGMPGETYLIGGRNERQNIDLVRMICSILDHMVDDLPDGGFASLITFVTDRPGHDLRYAVDPSRIERELGWKPEASFDAALQETVAWYLENEKV